MVEHVRKTPGFKMDSSLSDVLNRAQPVPHPPEPCTLRHLRCQVSSTPRNVNITKRTSEHTHCPTSRGFTGFHLLSAASCCCSFPPSSHPAPSPLCPRHPHRRRLDQSNHETELHRCTNTAFITPRRAQRLLQTSALRVLR